MDDAERARLLRALGEAVRGWVHKPGKRATPGPVRDPYCRFCEATFQGSDRVDWHASDCPVRVYEEAMER